MTGVADPPAFQVLNEVGIIAQLSRTRAERLLRPELNLAQFAILNHFHRLGGEHSLVRLAGAMQVTKGAMTNTITRLHAKGWVAVRPDPQDGRGKLAAITEVGRQVRQRAMRVLAGDLADMPVATQGQDLPALLAGLRGIRQWLDTNR